MKILKFLSLLLCLVVLLHTSILMGFVYNVPVIGGMMRKAYIDLNPTPLEKYPYKVYTLLGRAIWQIPGIENTIGDAYGEIIRQIKEHRVELRHVKKMFTIRILNWIVLISVVSTILFFVLDKPSRKKRILR